jgi:hypothetical protein
MKENAKLILVASISIILSSTIAITATTMIQSSSVSYDNTTVDAALDNLFDVVDLQEQIDALKTSSLSFDTIYPVGSIYISTSSTNPSKLFGGTWESYGTGRTLVGVGSNGTTSYTAGSEGGNVSGKATLAVKNLPSHTHTVTAEGTISSTFTGKAVTSGNNSVTPTASFTGTKGTTSSSGSHTHLFSAGGHALVLGADKDNGTTATNGFVNSVANGVWWAGANKNIANINTAGEHTHTLTPSGTVSLSNTDHTHSVTAKGTVSSTFTGTEVTSSATGSGTAFSTQDAYVVVYIWKRTK